MSYPNASLCRVELHADAWQLDLALPAGVPIAALIPSVVDLAADRGAGRRGTAPMAVSYRLSCPGAPALDSSKTLSQHGIRDGAVLLLTRAAEELPAPRFDDPAEQISATVCARTRPWTPRSTRLTASLAATWLAAVAGFVAVPGGPGAPNALLAATAAATVAMLAMHLGDAGPVSTAVCCLYVLVAVAALAVVLTRISPQVLGALIAAASICLLQVATRVSITVAGLSRRPDAPSVDSDDKSIRAHDLLTGLVAALSAAAALGVVGAAVGVHTSGGPRFGGVVFAAVSAAALLLRARWHTERCQIAALVTGGIAALSAALVAAAVTVPQHPLWLSATAAGLAVGALYLGFAAPALSPLSRRGVELLEYLALAAMVPAACWICGCYGAARGLSLT